MSSSMSHLVEDGVVGYNPVAMPSGSNVPHHFGVGLRA